MDNRGAGGRNISGVKPMEVLGWVITGGVAAAVVKLIDNVVQWQLNRSGKAADRKRQDNAEIREAITGLQRGQRVLLFDRIKHLGERYLIAGEVDIDDRRNLHNMHDAYKALGGNGDLNILMNQVNQLDLKNRERR